MQTFTDKEIRYLNRLRKRNICNHSPGNGGPLNKPMSVEERKLRSNIRRKCHIFMYELVLADSLGLALDKELGKKGCGDIYTAMDGLSLSLLFREYEERKNTEQDKQEPDS